MWPPIPILGGLTITLLVAGGLSQAADQRAPESAELEAVLAGRSPGKVAWTGDLPGMKSRKLIRVLVPHDRTFFFYDGLQPRGFAYEFMTEFGKVINGTAQGAARTEILFLPTSRDRFIPDVAEGYADIAVAGLTVTASREKQVDFVPYARTMNEIVVTGPGAARLSSLEDLSGKAVFVRRSSSYFESMSALNARLKQADRQPVRIKLADEHLETEDILELVNAGVVPITICDAYIAKLWATVLPEIRVHGDLVARADAHFGPIIRKGSPVLEKALADFIRTHGPGTTFGNVLIKRYAAENRWVRDRRDRGSQALRRGVAVLRAVRQAVRLRPPVDRGTGLPGVAYRPAAQEPGRGGGRHADQARDRGRPQRGRSRCACHGEQHPRRG